MSAVHPRINGAIETALHGDTQLRNLLTTAGARLLPGNDLPLYLIKAPSKAPRPYLVYGPSQREAPLETAGCGTADSATVIYEVLLVSEGVTPETQVAVVDRVSALLSDLKTVVAGVPMQFWAHEALFDVQFNSLETGITVCGESYRIRLALAG